MLPEKKHASTFGVNRATGNRIYCIIPMYIEADFIRILNPGFYTFGIIFDVETNITIQIFVKSFKVNNDLIELHDYQKRDPYFQFIQAH